MCIFHHIRIRKIVWQWQRQRRWRQHNIAIRWLFRKQHQSFLIALNFRSFSRYSFFPFSRQLLIRLKTWLKVSFFSRSCFLLSSTLLCVDSVLLYVQFHGYGYRVFFLRHSNHIYTVSLKNKFFFSLFYFAANDTHDKRRKE